MARFLITRPEPRSLYRFGSMQEKSGGARIALGACPVSSGKAVLS